jgi:hypothetical protein
MMTNFCGHTLGDYDGRRRLVESRTVSDVTHEYSSSRRLQLQALKTLPRCTAQLVKLGWSFAYTNDVLPASAVANPYTKQILCKEAMRDRNRKRDWMYVLKHEKGHAIDFETGIPSRVLAKELGLSDSGGQEALAQAISLWSASSSTDMPGWIKVAIRFHAAKNIDYSWQHVIDPLTKDLADVLIRGFANQTYTMGKYWVYREDIGEVVKLGTIT